MGRLYVKQARNPKIWRTRHIEAASSCMIPIYPVPYFFQGKASFSISDLPQLVVCPSAITFCFFHIFSLQIQEPRHSLCRGSFLSLDVSLQNSSKISQKYFSVPSIRPSFFRLIPFLVSGWPNLPPFPRPSPARKSRFSRRFCQKLHTLSFCRYIFLPVFRHLFAQGLSACVLSGNI